VLAFGYFLFKAGYVQSELLFYTLFFDLSRLLSSVGGPACTRQHRASGFGRILAGLAHLTQRQRCCRLSRFF
jgi:hypothetical protein